nr:type II toxin-antitoxin system HigB family toxin [Enterobacter sp. MF024]
MRHVNLKITTFYEHFYFVEHSIKGLWVSILSTHFQLHIIFIKHISTHAEYDKLTDLYRRTKE